MKVLVTGCLGFIGQAVANALSKEGHEVWRLSRSEHLQGHEYHITWDLKMPLRNELMPPAVDCVIHAAATMNKDVAPGEMFRVNTAATLDLLDYAHWAGARNFIYFSSGGVYGYQDGLIGEESPCNPIGLYGLTKYESELLVKHYREFFSTKILRLFFPYGAGQSRGIVPTLYGRLKDNLPISVVNGGRPYINPVNIKDIEKLVEILLDDAEHRLLNVAGEERISIVGLSRLLAEEEGREPLFVESQEPGVLDLIADIERARHELQWRPKIHLSEGISSFVAGRTEKPLQ